MASPSQLSRELRLGTSPDLTRRRWIIGLSLVTVAAGQIVSLYQTGIIHHLPDPPLAVFDSDKVDASDYAYKRLQSPDAPAMIVTGGLTTMLAAAGPMNRAHSMPAVPLAMAVKTLLDVAINVKLGMEEWQANKKLCFYCQLSTVAALAAAVLAMPEAGKAARNMLAARQAHASRLS